MSKLIYIVVMFLILSALNVSYGQERSAAPPENSVKPNQTTKNIRILKFPKFFHPLKRAFKRMLGLKTYTCILVNNPPILNRIELNQTEIADKVKRKLHVTIDAIDQENDPLSYSYETTGGKIIGQGRHVIWDLTDLAPKVYIIKVCVDDGSGCNIKNARNVRTKEFRVVKR